MSGIKQLEELREYGHDCCARIDDAIHDYCDEIEREISERYMALPVDADGVPIHVGDLIEFGSKGERLEVTHIGLTKHGDSTIAYRRPNGTLDCSCIGSECRHVNPRTVEDVLRDCCNEWNQHLGSDWEAGVYAKYAAEIRGLIGGDA